MIDSKQDNFAQIILAVSCYMRGFIAKLVSYTELIGQQHRLVHTYNNMVERILVVITGNSCGVTITSHQMIEESLFNLISIKVLF